MNFLKLAESRFSVRSYSDQLVEQLKLDAILRAGQVAPTACNLQPQRILVLKDISALNKLKNCTPCHFNAPLAIITCCSREACWKRNKYDGKSSGEIDASIVTTHMMLEAADLGLGSTWVMYFDPDALRAEFNIPEDYEPVSILVMGYPDENAEPAPGHSEIKPLSETVSYNCF